MGMIRENDCISRDEVCRYVAEFVNHEFSTREEEELIDNIITGIEHMPSVTPQEPRWILVTEKPPDPGEDVLVTVNLGSVRVIGVDEYSLVEEDGFVGYGKDVIAWKPLPRPAM